MKIDERRSAFVARTGRPILGVALAIGALLSVATWSPFPLSFAVLASLVAYPWYRSVSRGELNLVEPIVLHTVFLGMVVVALFDRVYLTDPGFDYAIVSRSHAEAFTLLCLCYAGLFASVIVGYYWLGPRVPSPSRVSGRLPAILDRAERASGSSFRLVAIGYLLLGIGSLAAIVLVVFPTNDPLYVFRTTTPRSELFAENNVLVLGVRGLYVGYLFWLAGALQDGRAPSLLELLAVVPVVALVLLTGGRSRAFQIVLMVGIVTYVVAIERAVPVTRGLLAGLTDRVPPAVALCALPIVGVAGAVVLVALRGLRQGESLASAIRDADPLAIATAGIQNDRFDNFLALTEVVPERFGYYYGTFYGRVPLNLIPRRLWSDKPVLTVGGMLRREILPSRAGGRNAGALGDYYVNFGYPGIVLLGAVYGATLHLLSRLIRGHSVSPLRLTLFAIFLSLFVRIGLTNGVLYNGLIHAILLAPGVFALTVLSKWGGDRVTERDGATASD